MHHRRKHPTGKPQLRKNSSDWTYPIVEKGSIKHSRFSVVKHLNSLNHNLKEYLNYEAGDEGSIPF